LRFFLFLGFAISVKTPPTGPGFVLRRLGLFQRRTFFFATLARALRRGFAIRMAFHSAMIRLLFAAIGCNNNPRLTSSTISCGPDGEMFFAATLGRAVRLLHGAD
jgi:hypothetical protein